MSTFEIQIYNSENWHVDSYFYDRDVTLSEAERLDESCRHSGVRVVEENYDESSDQTTTNTIFRGGNLDRQEKARNGARAVTPRRRTGPREPAKNRWNRKNQKNGSFLVPGLILGILVMTGLAALFGLQELAQLR